MGESVQSLAWPADSAERAAAAIRAQPDAEERGRVWTARQPIGCLVREQVEGFCGRIGIGGLGKRREQDLRRGWWLAEEESEQWRLPPLAELAEACWWETGIGRATKGAKGDTNPPQHAF